MQTPKINYITESTILAVGNKIEKAASKITKKASEAVKPAATEPIAVSMNAVGTSFDPQMSYALSHGCVPNAELGKHLYTFV